MFPCSRPRLRIWSRETGSAVPFRVSLLILHTQAESNLVLTHGGFLPISVAASIYSLFIPPAAIGSVSITYFINCVTRVFTTESPPAQNR